MQAIDPSGKRFGLQPDDSGREILALASNPKLELVQFSHPLPDALFKLLNEALFAHRPDVKLRAYGFYGKQCDLSFCRILTNVRRFSADCLQNAVSVEAIASMEKLRELSIGIFDLESFDILQELPREMETLYLLPTKSRKPSLRWLERFINLTKLTLGGQQKQIEVISSLRKLKELTLSGISLPSLEALRPLEGLRSLSLFLGGCSNLAALDVLQNLRFFQCVRIRELYDIGVISQLKGLQFLDLEDLPHIKVLPSLSGLIHLRRIMLDSLKGLRDLSSLLRLEHSFELAHFGSKLAPDDYIPLLRSGKITHAQVGLGSKEKNKKFDELCQQYQVSTGILPPFVFEDGEREENLL